MCREITVCFPWSCCHEGVDTGPCLLGRDRLEMVVRREMVRSSCVYTTFCLLWLVQRNVLLTLVKILVSLQIIFTVSQHIYIRL